MICNYKNALLNLAEGQLDKLPEESLKWFEGFTHTAETQADNIAETLTALAVVMSDDNSINKPCDSQLSSILFGLGEHLNSVSAMINIGGEAAYYRQKKRIAIDLPEEHRVQLEVLAESQGISREELASRLIASGIDEMRHEASRPVKVKSIRS